MYLPSFIEEGLSRNLGFRISSIQTVSGGDINHDFRILVEGEAEAYFLKYNSSDGHQDIIGAEAKALELFSEHNIKSPKVIDYASDCEGSYLVMEYINSEKKWNPASIESFAKALASLHKVKNSHYGLSYNNRIGSLYQANKWCKSFSDYYWQTRLFPQLELAHSNNYLKSPYEFEYMRVRLEEFPTDSPSLIHGDLWSGNYLMDSSNEAYLIDPSISYGHREMDLAMMDLFGGFPEAVFDAYHTELAIHNSWKDRKDIFQLYYLLVHLNLFGISYLSQVDSILRKYE